LAYVVASLTQSPCRHDARQEQTASPVEDAHKSPQLYESCLHVGVNPDSQVLSLLEKQELQAFEELPARMAW
jgi:hypothetical protein